MTSKGDKFLYLRWAPKCLVIAKKGKPEAVEDKPGVHHEESVTAKRYQVIGNKHVCLDQMTPILLQGTINLNSNPKKH